MTKKNPLNGPGKAEARQLLLHGLGQIAFVLRPFPSSLEEQPESLNAALAWMREADLIHGSQREPNLTRLGVELAEQLAVEAAQKEATP